jgi:hypothetical protein
MSKQITLQLSDDLVARAYEIATRSDQPLEDILADWIHQYVDDLPIETLADNEVLLLCQYELDQTHKNELRQLLYIHQERKLNFTEQLRLDELLQIYRKGIIRKSRAIQVACARGLIADRQAG